MSKLIVNTGSMFSGKTTLLLQQGEKHIQANQNIIYIKPTIDTRYSTSHIVTHTKLSVPAISVDVEGKIYDIVKDHNVSVVLIDEIQFFEKSIISDIWSLISEGITVYVSGLDMDFNAKPFETTSELMAMADMVNKLKAVCHQCTAEATMSYKLNGGNNRIELGEKDLYLALCKECYFANIHNKGER